MESNEILVPVDFGEHAREAAMHGIRLARQLGGTVTILHAVCGAPPPVAPMDYVGMPPAKDVLEAATRHLSEFVASLDQEGVEVTEQIVSGYPATAILDRIEATKPRMVVMGTHGRTGLARLVNA